MCTVGLKQQKADSSTNLNFSSFSLLSGLTYLHVSVWQHAILQTVLKAAKIYRA